MIVWINGAHGAGKTSVARRLARALPGAAIVDPEQIGFLLRRIWPGPLRPDFKDLPAWRALTLTTLREAVGANPAATLIVPMTLTDGAHFDEMIGGFRTGGIDLRHFTLIASTRTLRKRLRWRLDWPASRRWALAEAERCADLLGDPHFATHVPTDGRTVEEVAAEVLGGLAAGG